MSKLTDFGENWMCNFVRNQVAPLPSVFHVALLASATDDTFAEVSWTGYERKPIARDLSSWCGTQGVGTTGISSGASHTTSNNVEIDFGITDASVTVASIGLFASGDFFAYCTLAAPLSFSPGDAVKILPATLQFTLGATGGMTDFLSNKMIDFVWRGQPYSYPATQHLALFTYPPTNAGGGAEVASGGYSRVGVNSALWTQPTEGIILNQETLSFSPPIADWGNVTACGLFDSATNANLLWWCNVTPKTIVAGSGRPEFERGYLKIQFL